MQAESIQDHGHASRPRPRICSGGCQFFSPEYNKGRKIAGMGSCDKHDSQLSVQVGEFCVWLTSRVSAPAAASAQTGLTIRR